MLELEVLPERALATAQWELVLGRYQYVCGFVCSECYSLYGGVVFTDTILCVVGMPLSQALEILQLHSRVVQTSQLTYSEQVNTYD